MVLAGGQAEPQWFPCSNLLNFCGKNLREAVPYSFRVVVLVTTPSDNFCFLAANYQIKLLFIEKGSSQHVGSVVARSHVPNIGALLILSCQSNLCLWVVVRCW